MTKQDRYGNKFEAGCKVLCIESGRKGKVLDMSCGEIHVKFQGSTEVEIHYSYSIIVLESAEEQEIDFIKDTVMFLELNEYMGAKYKTRITNLSSTMVPVIESFNEDNKDFNEILLQYLENKYGE